MAIWLPVLALLHHYQFHGSLLDYLGLAIAVAASWIGVPGPGEPVLIAAGVVAAKHHLDIVTVVVVAWAAATTGGVFGWLLGRRAGRAVVIGPGPFRTLRMGALSRGERVFASHPVIAIILTPSWVAGIHRPRGIVYQPINAVAAAVWAAGIGFGAYLIGPDVVDLAGDFGLVSAVVVAFGVAIGVVLEVRHQRRRRDRRLGLERQPATEASAPAGGPTDPCEPS